MATVALSGIITPTNVVTATSTTTLTNKTIATPTITGVTTFSAGTAALPALTTSGDTNTGIFFPAADTIAFSEGGAEAMRIDSSGNLLVGTTNTAAGKIGVLGRMGAFNTTGANDSLIQIWNNGTTSNIASSYSSTGAYTPLTFLTSDVERLRLPTAGGVQAVTTISVGNATPSSSGAGITFPASMSDSTNANTLDDYEEGTWTPELADATSGGNLFTMDTQQGFYTKVGNVATLYYRVTWTSKGSASGVVRFRGFPFQAKGTTLGYYFTGATANSNGQLTTALGGNSSQAIFLDSTGGAGTVAEFSASDTGTGMNGSITYLTN
jgi:hypothetical protein